MHPRCLRKGAPSRNAKVECGRNYRKANEQVNEFSKSRKRCKIPRNSHLRREGMDNFLIGTKQDILRHAEIIIHCCRFRGVYSLHNSFLSQRHRLRGSIAEERLLQIMNTRCGLIAAISKKFARLFAFNLQQLAILKLFVL